MKKASFTITERRLCEECAVALRRFIGGLDGVDSVDLEGERIVVSFDENEIGRERIAEITKDSIRKLGYDLEQSSEPPHA